MQRKRSVGRQELTGAKRLSRVVQTGGDAVHGGADSVVESRMDNGICSGTFAAQQVDLDQAERIDIGVAEADGAGEDGVFLQEIVLAGDRQNDTGGALEFLAEHFEDSVTKGGVGYEIGVKAGDGEVGLGHGDFNAADEAREKREAAHHFAEEFGVCRGAAGEAIEGVADSEPGGNGVAALHPAEDPGDGAEIVQI